MDQTAQTITLRDGRTLGYAEWGDLNGKPVFFFGGSNSARLIRYPNETVITEMGIHLYTFDRPGMGLSTRQPHRRLLNWAENMWEFAQIKHIQRFAVIGTSQGGPYAAACAFALEEMLAGVSLVSAVAGLDNAIVMDTQSAGIRTMLRVARHAPWLMTLQNNLSRPLINSRYASRAVQAILGNLPKSDQAILNALDIPTIMIEDLREGTRQGGAGATDDMRAVILDWGFELTNIRSKVFIWQGEEDPNVTPAMARYLAERIPDNDCTTIAGAGHLLIFSHWRDIMEQLLNHWDA